jgi:hypothetical protein
MFFSVYYNISRVIIHIQHFVASSKKNTCMITKKYMLMFFAKLLAVKNASLSEEVAQVPEVGTQAASARVGAVFDRQNDTH